MKELRDLNGGDIKFTFFGHATRDEVSRHFVLNSRKVDRCKATWKREFKLPRREASPPYHHDDKVDSDQ